MKQEAKKDNSRRLLRDARLQRHWTQKEVAERIETTPNNVSRWELGQTAPSLYFLAKLCTLFGTSAKELGLMPADEPPDDPSAVLPMDASATDVLSLWTVPYKRNRYFTGRDEFFDLLDQHLSPRTPPMLDNPYPTYRVALTQTQAIKGLGGIGKTQIAIEYAYRSREQGRYTHIFWVDAATEETILASFEALGDLLPDVSATKEKNQHKLVATIKHWLEHCPQRWLLIFDNVEDIPLIQEYCPQCGEGSFLFTTRISAVGALASSIEIPAMGIVEGTTLLLDRAQRQNATQEEQLEAMNVVMALDGFPLALDQAGAYIEETGCTFREYLHLYQDHRHALLARRGTQTTSYPASVATTWSLSFERVAQSSPAATDLLRLCAFLAPDHIPEELLKEGAPYWPAALQDAARDPIAFNQMLEAVLRFSLMQRLTDQRLLRIHRLVQAVLLDTMTREKRCQWAERAVQAVNLVFPRDPKNEIASWPQCLRYLEQGQACDVLIQQYTLGMPEAADLLYRTGVYLLEHALYSLAEPLFHRARQIWGQQPGEMRTQEAEPLKALALLYKYQGKFAEAESFCQQALRIFEQQGGADNLKMASPLYNLALIYEEQGKYAETEPLYRRARHIWEQNLGAGHSQVAYALNGLANLYYQQGRYEEAEPLYQQALQIWKQQLGETHPLVAYPLQNLAMIYKQQRKFAQSEAFYRQTLRIWKEQLGPEHTQLASVLINLAHLQSEQGMVEEAESLYHEVLRIVEPQLGPDHLAVAHVCNGLANLRRGQSRYAEAEQLYERALRIRECLDPMHPDRAESLYDLAMLREAQGSCKEAISLYRRALLIREHVYGLQHARTIETRERLQKVSQVAFLSEEATEVSHG